MVFLEHNRVWCYKDRSNILFYIAYSFFQAQLCVISKHTVNVPTMQKKLAVVLPAMLAVEFSVGLDIFPKSNSNSYQSHLFSFPIQPNPKPIYLRHG
jgi:hypothetical protein